MTYHFQVKLAPVEHCLVEFAKCTQGILWAPEFHNSRKINKHIKQISSAGLGGSGEKREKNTVTTKTRK